MNLIISGGQSGADLAGCLGAQRASVPTLIRTFHGFTPIGRLALPEGLPVEWLEEIPSHWTYRQKLKTRTKANVVRADGTVVFVTQPIDSTRGSLLTVNTCLVMGKPVLVLNPTYNNLLALRAFLRGLDVVNIAGQRNVDEDLVTDYVAEALSSLAPGSPSPRADEGESVRDTGG